ncbi:WhiB family transcriptional regulator [Streptomyces antnestii]|uniref:Transcriptional regulator WhiB n=2 Tax=Streptomyces antnestii TaxID=2494256 RepID=A0A437Q354_9ACTN|nr:WhiB family transcriptional regulator [Streptomyces sp. San01]
MIVCFSPCGTIGGMYSNNTLRPVTPVPPVPSWQDAALCAQTGGDFFFPEPGSSVREAKSICGLCEIRTACLDYALANDERFGVWGGLSEKERLQLRRG